MDDELRARLDAQDQAIAAIYASAEKSRKYFLWTLIITIVTIVLPIIGMLFAIPMLMNAYSSALGGAGMLGL